MAELHIEIALCLDTCPTGGVEVSILRRVRGEALRVVRWSFTDQFLDSNDLQDVIGALSQAVQEQFLLTPGVQLVLHD